MIFVAGFFSCLSPRPDKSRVSETTATIGGGNSFRVAGTKAAAPGVPGPHLHQQTEGNKS